MERRTFRIIGYLFIIFMTVYGPRLIAKMMNLEKGIKVTGQQQHSKQAAIKSQDAVFNKISKRYEQALFEYWPENALFEGTTGVKQDKFGDYSSEGMQRWYDEQAAVLSKLNDINPRALSTHSKQLTYQILKENLSNQLNTTVCKTELWAVNPLLGWHNVTAMLMDRQPVKTKAERADAIKRWRQFGRLSQQQLDNLKIGLKEGYTAPVPAVRRVITQMKLMLTDDATIETSPYYVSIKKTDDAEFKKDMTDIIHGINMELKRHINFLENTYLPKARKVVGVSANPEGNKCYQASIIEKSTLYKTPDEIHQIGLQHIETLKKEVAIIGQKLYQTTDMATVLNKAREASTGEFQTEQAMLQYVNRALERVKKKVPQYFDRIPHSEGIVKPYPLHRAKTGAAGEYNPPADDGSSPGVFSMNTYNPAKHSRIDLEATLYHELIPGHHFQMALQLEDKTQNSINRYLWNSGFVEGWALYAERLADQMGVYQDQIARLGMISNEALRASRLVVDTGIHAKGWTRQQAIDYMKQHTAANEIIIEGEVDRYIMFPGQAVSYMLGKMEIEALRDWAKAELGPLFSLRAYHRQVLKNGSQTLPLLRQEIERWVEQQKSTKA